MCARASLTDAAASAVESIVRDGSFDWDLAISIANAHKVIPLLHANLVDCAQDAVPDTHLQILRVTSRARVMHVLMLTAEMAAIGERLREAKIPVLVLKGPSLSSAYGGVALRPFVDNDILIRRSDFERADQLLLKMGFQRKDRGSLQKAGYLLVHGEYTFGRMIGNLISTVDLHTNVLPVGYAYNESLDALQGRGRSLELAGSTFTALSWPDLLLALCVNALKDQWMNLRLATDIAEVATCIDDWDVVMTRAKRMRSLRVVKVALLIAHHAVGADIPDRILQACRDDARAVRLASWVEGRFATYSMNDSLTGRERVRLNMNVQDGIIGRLRYIGYAGIRRVTESFIDPKE